MSRLERARRRRRIRQGPDSHQHKVANENAVACFIGTEERRQRGRHRPSEGRLCVKLIPRTRRRGT
jgi:hypothetical protein